jgi:outer membrane immunogenic protein
MKKLLLAGITGIALVASAPADAADLRKPTYKAPPPVVAPVPIFTWTGLYIGGNVGYGWSHTSTIGVRKSTRHCIVQVST